MKILLGIIIGLLLAVVAAGSGYLYMNHTHLLSAGPSHSQTPLSRSTSDESNEIIIEIKQDLIKEHGSVADTLALTISKVEGDYASGQASDQGGGGMWFAQKVNGIWHIVWDGNGIINCQNLTAYPHYPTDLIPDCFDNAKQESVKR